MTFEYVLLGGINDQPEHAAEVLALLKGMQAKVNLIVWNPGPGIAYHQPAPEAVDRFHKLLIAGGIPDLYAETSRARHLRRLRAAEAHRRGGTGAGFDLGVGARAGRR